MSKNEFEGVLISPREPTRAEETLLSLKGRARQLLKDAEDLSKISGDLRVGKIREQLQNYLKELGSANSEKYLQDYKDKISEVESQLAILRVAAHYGFSVKEIDCKSKDVGVKKQGDRLRIIVPSTMVKEKGLEILVNADIAEAVLNEMNSSRYGTASYILLQLLSSDDLVLKHNAVGAALVVLADYKKISTGKAAEMEDFAIVFQNKSYQVVEEVMNVIETVRKGDYAVSESAEREWKRYIEKKYGNLEKAREIIKEKIKNCDFSDRAKGLMLEALDWAYQKTFIEKVFDAQQYWVFGILDETLDATKGKQTIDSTDFLVLAYRLQRSLHKKYEQGISANFSTGMMVRDVRDLANMMNPSNPSQYIFTGLSYREFTATNMGDLTKWGASFNVGVSADGKITQTLSLSLRSLVFNVPVFVGGNEVGVTKSKAELIKENISLYYGPIGFGFYEGKACVFSGMVRAELGSGKVLINAPAPVLAVILAFQFFPQVISMGQRVQSPPLLFGSIGYEAIEMVLPITAIRELINIADELLPNISRKQTVSFAEFSQMVYIIDLLLKNNKYNIALTYLDKLLEAKSLNPFFKAQLQALRDDAVQMEIVHMKIGESLSPGQVIRKKVLNSIKETRELLSKLKKGSKMSKEDAEKLLANFAYLSNKLVITTRGQSVIYNPDIFAADAKEYRDLICLLMDAGSFIIDRGVISTYQKNWASENIENAAAFGIFMFYLDNLITAVSASLGEKAEYVNWLVSMDKLHNKEGVNLRLLAAIAANHYNLLNDLKRKGELANFEKAYMDARVFSSIGLLERVAKGEIYTPELAAFSDYVMSGKNIAALDVSRYGTLINAVSTLSWAQTTERYLHEKNLLEAFDKAKKLFESGASLSEINDAVMILAISASDIKEVWELRDALKKNESNEKIREKFAALEKAINKETLFFSSVEKLEGMLKEVIKKQPDSVLNNLKYSRELKRMESTFYNKISDLISEQENLDRDLPNTIQKVGKLVNESGANQLIGYDARSLYGRNVEKLVKKLGEKIEKKASYEDLKSIVAELKQFVGTGPGGKELEEIENSLNAKKSYDELMELYKELDQASSGIVNYGVYGALKKLPPFGAEAAGIYAFGFGKKSRANKELIAKIVKIAVLDAVLDAMISKLSAVKSKEFNEQQKKYLKKLEDERKELVDSVNKDLSKVGRGAASGVFGYSEAALRKYAKKYMEQLGYEEIVAAVPGLRLDADDVLAEHIVGVEEEFAKKFMMALRGRADALIEVRSRLKDAADELEKKINELEGHGKLKKEELAKTNEAIEKIREALDLINKALSDVDASLQSLSELSGMYGGYLIGKKNYAGFLDYLSKMEREKGYRRPTTYTQTKEF